MRNGSDVPPAIPWIGRCAVAALGIVVAVLATSRSGGLPAGGIGHTLDLDIPGWLLVVLAVAAVAMALAVLSTLIPPPRKKDPEDFFREPPPPPKLSPLVLAMVLLLLALVTAGIVLGFYLVDFGHAGAAMTGTAGAAAQLPAVPPEPLHGAVHAPALNWGLTLAIGAAAAIVAAAALSVAANNEPWLAAGQWFRRRTRRKPALAQDLAAAVSVGMRALESGSDPRAAIIACYRRCEAAIAARRRRRHPAETAREFVSGALVALRLPEPAIRSLLAVFERARFGDLPVTSSDRDVALGAFGAIRRALGRTGQDGTSS